MSFTFRIFKHVEEVVSYIYVNFGTILCTNKHTNSRRTSKGFAVFKAILWFFSFISLEIQCHNEMIFTFRICKQVEKVVNYIYVYLGTISCTDIYTNSRKISKGFAVFRAVLCLFVYFSANTMS